MGGNAGSSKVASKLAGAAKPNCSTRKPFASQLKETSRLQVFLIKQSCELLAVEKSKNTG